MGEARRAGRLGLASLGQRYKGPGHGYPFVSGGPESGLADLNVPVLSEAEGSKGEPLMVSQSNHERLFIPRFFVTKYWNWFGNWFSDPTL